MFGIIELSYQSLKLKILNNSKAFLIKVEVIKKNGSR